jgi:hypothetical protein
VNKEQNDPFGSQAFDRLMNQRADLLFTRSTDHPIIR